MFDADYDEELDLECEHCSCYWDGYECCDCGDYGDIIEPEDEDESDE